VKSYVFRVAVEPDEERWQAYCPILERYGAVTWGYTREEALKNIHEVVAMILEELEEEKEPMKPSQNSLFKADTYVRSVAESGILGLVHTRRP
jgi:predicted RNase H-like HicB family nuclease